MKSILSLFMLLCVLAAAAVAQDAGKEKETKPEAPKVETPAAPAKKVPARVKGQPLAFPEVDGWTKGDLVKYPQAELGYSVNYDGKSGSRVSVYVYNGGRTDIRNSLTGAVKEEIDRAKAEIDAVAEMGVYSDVKVVSDEKMKLGGKSGKIDVLRKALSFKARGTELHSEIIIFPFEGDFVKIRATRPRTAGVEAEDAVKALFSEIDAFFVMYMDISDAARTAVH
jgi:hypothetical protein